MQARKLALQSKAVGCDWKLIHLQSGLERLASELPQIRRAASFELVTCSVPPSTNSLTSVVLTRNMRAADSALIGRTSAAHRSHRTSEAAESGRTTVRSRVCTVTVRRLIIVISANASLSFAPHARHARRFPREQREFQSRRPEMS